MDAVSIGLETVAKVGWDAVWCLEVGRLAAAAAGIIRLGWEVGQRGSHWVGRWMERLLGRFGGPGGRAHADASEGRVCRPRGVGVAQASSATLTAW